MNDIFNEPFYDQYDERNHDIKRIVKMTSKNREKIFLRRPPPQKPCQKRGVGGYYRLVKIILTFWLKIS